MLITHVNNKNHTGLLYQWQKISVTSLNFRFFVLHQKKIKFAAETIKNKFCGHF